MPLSDPELPDHEKKNSEPPSKALEEKVNRWNIKGCKLYTAEWRGDSKGWKLTDPMARRYLGAEKGGVYADAVSQYETMLLRIEPGELRVWDFTDEQDLVGAESPQGR